MSLELVLYPDERLTTPCKEVKKVTPELRQLAKDMYQFMLENNGIGLAANQVGKDMCLIVGDDNGKPVYMFNPRIMLLGNKRKMSEGCLSFPGETIELKRAITVTVKYLDLNNSPRVFTFRGLIAQVIQHEIEHLRGITYHDTLEKQNKEKK